MKDKTWIQNPKIYASHDAHVKKSDHLKLRCDDGNRLRADFDGRAHSQAGRVENGWYGGAVRSGWDGWGGILDPRERRWMLICYSRERERKESEALVASGLNYSAKIGPLFIHRPQLFFSESAQRGGKHIFTSCGAVNCAVENISLYDCIDLCWPRGQKRMEAWSYVTLAH